MLDLEHFVPYRLSVLSNRISNAIARNYRDRFDLAVTEWRVIAILGRYPGLSAREVATRSAMDKVAVSRAVKRLLARGRIRRKLNASDRRATHLWLTPQGRSVYRAIVPAALAFEAELLAALDPDELTMLDRLLERLQLAAEAL